MGAASVQTYITGSPNERFLQLPVNLTHESFLRMWENNVFRLLLDENRIEPTIAARIRSWRHSDFSVDRDAVVQHGGRSMAVELSTCRGSRGSANGYVVIDGDGLPGSIRVWYAELCVRPCSHASYPDGVFRNTTGLVAADSNGQWLDLRCNLEDGVVEHRITANRDVVEFDTTASNHGDGPADVAWEGAVHHRRCVYGN